MPVDRRKVALYVFAANVRLVLFVVFPGIPDLLTRQVEVSTPLNSFKRRMPYPYLSGRPKLTFGLVQEGLFLFERNVSPYDGGIFHQVCTARPLL